MLTRSTTGGTGASRRGGKREASPAIRLLRRAAIVAGILLGLAFLVEGGEWGTIDLVRQRTRLATMRDTVQTLETRLDSLRTEYKLVTTDPARLERIAREYYGMVKGKKELLYWVRAEGEADSARVRSPRN